MARALKVALPLEIPLVNPDFVKSITITRQTVDSWIEQLVNEDDENTSYTTITIKTNLGFILHYQDEFTYNHRRNPFGYTEPASERNVQARLTVRKTKTPISIDGIGQIYRLMDSILADNMNFTMEGQRTITHRFKKACNTIYGEQDWNGAEAIKNIRLKDFIKHIDVDTKTLKTPKPTLEWTGAQGLLKQSLNTLLRSLGKTTQVKL